MLEEHMEEYVKCFKSFTYFCENYVKIRPDHFFKQNGEEGLINFKLYPEQKLLHEFCDKNKWVIGTQYRRAGFTTLMVVRQLWKCMFKLDQSTLYLFPYDRFAKNECDTVKSVIKNLPDWLAPKAEWRANSIFMPETNGKMVFKGLVSSWHLSAMDDIIIDNAGCSRDKIDWNWNDLNSSLIPKKGDLTIISNAVWRGKFFCDIYKEAVKGKHKCKIFTCHYKNHPHYSPEWEVSTKENLGEKAWKYEVEQYMDDVLNNQ